MKKIILSFLISHCAFLISQVSVGQIIHVPADQPTIQAGINAAGDGDTLLVADGTYLENINFNGKAITVASHYLMDSDTNHINNTVIDGSQPANPDFGSVVTFITGEDSTSVICGFTITGGSGMTETVSGARIGGGIICYYSSAKIMHNKITGNVVSSPSDAWGGGMISINDANGKWTVVTGNVITGNQSLVASGNASGGGAEIWGNSKIFDNYISGNHCECTSGNTFGGGIVVNSSSGQDTAFLGHNIILNNSSVGETSFGGGFYSSILSLQLMDNLISNNSLNGLEVYGGGAYIGESEGDIRVEQNIIRENVTTASTNSAGGGVLISANLAKTELIRNLISFNFSVGNSFGAGLYVYNYFESPVIIDGNTFEGNDFEGVGAGGAIYLYGSTHFVLSNNLFLNNHATASGGAIYMYSSSESGYVLSKGESQNIDIPLSANNTASLKQYDDYKLVNNTFTGNVADYGGGAIRCNLPSTSFIVLNTIFWENEAASGHSINYSGADTIFIYYSDFDPAGISGTWTGEGNINADPQFIDEYCHIGPESPCVNKGTDSLYIAGTWYYCPLVDFDGDERPYPSIYCDPIPDIGADEIEFDCEGEVELRTQNSKLNIQIYPNPTSGISHFSFHISQYQYVSLRIYDLHGREVATVLDEKLPAGEHVVRYDMSGLPGGIYFLRVQAGQEVATRKIIVSR